MRRKPRLAKLFGIPMLALCGFLIAASLASVGLATDTTGTTTAPPTTTVPESPCFGITLDNPSSDKKVSLCHFTGGPNFVLNEPSISALETHVGHHGDCYKEFNQPQVCIV